MIRRRLSGIVAVVLTVGVGAPAAAEERQLPAAPGIFAPSRLEPFVRQAASAPAAPRQETAARAPRRDSIWNGGLIGAAIGGVGGSALIVASRGGSDDIPRAMLNVCVPPALAGFAVGAIVDALR
jgi:hypothetical protein